MSQALSSFYADYQSALEAHKLGTALLDTRVPVIKREGTPSPDTAGSGGSEETIRSRLTAGAYAANVHVLYSDMRSVFVSLLTAEQLGSDAYEAIYSFFRFAVDLLLREAARLTLIEPTGPEHTGDHFLHTFSASYHKIYADVDEWYGESLYTITQSGPMFTSMTGRASIDPRETEEHGAVHPTKLLPHISSSGGVSGDPVLGELSMLPTNYPQPAAPPTELLSTFTHPVRTPLSHTNWIQADPYASFAPSHDDGGSLAPVDYSSAIWVERSRRLKDADDRMKMDDTVIGGDDASHEATSNPESRSVTPQNGANLTAPLPIVPPSISGAVTSAAREPVPNGNVAPIPKPQPEPDLVAALQWTPANFVDDDEFEAAEQGKELELVSRLLLELQYRQRERLAAPGFDFAVSDEELHLHLKIQNILGRLAQDAGPGDLELPLSTKLPVLMRNYIGTLPYSEQNPPTQQQHPQRLASLGPQRQANKATPKRK